MALTKDRTVSAHVIPVGFQGQIRRRQGLHIYSHRLGTVESVFGNINTNKRLNRFTLRGKAKVNTQWLMYCMVHTIEKLQHYSSIG